jgi:RNA polymerase sigma-70 factor (ECF subfamily)
MSRVRDNDDPVAFPQLYALYALRILVYLRRRLPPADVADGHSATFLKAWAGRKSYDPHRGSPLTWLCSLAQHTACDILRAGRRRRRVHLDVSTLRDCRAGPEALVEDAELRAKLRQKTAQVLAAFPVWIGTAWSLRLQGTSFKDIAGIVGKAQGTVASTLHRVKHRIVATMRREDSGEGKEMSMEPDRARTAKEETECLAEMARRNKELVTAADEAVKELLSAAASLSAEDWAKAEGALSTLWNASPTLYRKTLLRLREAKERLSENPDSSIGRTELREVGRILREALSS